MISKRDVAWYLVSTWLDDHVDTDRIDRFEAGLTAGAALGWGIAHVAPAASIAIRHQAGIMAGSLRAGLVRGGAAASPFVAAAAFGYVSGALAGTALGRALDGDRGQAAALELYTGQVSWDKYWSTVRSGLSTL